MSDVAERAGVSRQTLYNVFGSRPLLAQAYVMREAEGFMAAVDAAIAANAEDPRAALRSALEVFLTAAVTHPMVRAITSASGGEEMLSLVTTRGGPLLGLVTSRLTEALTATWPRIARADAELAADALVRLAISYAALPSGPPSATASELARILAPSVDGLLGAGAQNS